LDLTFSPPATTAPTHALALVQNKIVAGGQNFLTRCSYDGIPDLTFTTGTAFNSEQTEVIIPEPSGNVVVGGTYGVRRLWLEPIPPTLPTFANTGLALVNGQFQLSACGGTEGQAVVIQASTNLSNWTSVSTNIVFGGCITFTDNQASLLPTRYYRMTLP
jgi:hypothetical protein